MCKRLDVILMFCLLKNGWKILEQRLLKLLVINMTRQYMISIKMGFMISLRNFLKFRLLIKNGMLKIAIGCINLSLVKKQLDGKRLMEKAISLMGKDICNQKNGYFRMDTGIILNQTGKWPRLDGLN